MERVSPSDREPVIVVENLTARYGDVTILENVSFEVYRGERFMILGGAAAGNRHCSSI
jgi:phospholipid/cholesterol/gamma-HCH transport system ATP-binding protein